MIAEITTAGIVIVYGHMSKSIPKKELNNFINFFFKYTHMKMY
jgi:hypothetical protein